MMYARGEARKARTTCPAGNNSDNITEPCGKDCPATGARSCPILEGVIWPLISLSGPCKPIIAIAESGIAMTCMTLVVNGSLGDMHSMGRIPNEMRRPHEMCDDRRYNRDATDAQ
jgi:hypothetical protein